MDIDPRLIDTVPIALPDTVHAVEFVVHIDERTGTVELRPAGNI